MEPLPAANIVAFGGHEPELDEPSFAAPGAWIIGEVQLASHASVWFGSILRGDINRISVGAFSNIQDLCVMHVAHDLPCTVGEYVTVGHNAVLHGCAVGRECLIGMGARVLDGAVVGDGSIIAAGAPVLEGMEIPPGTLAAGVPAKVKREVTAKERAAILRSAENYWGYAERFLAAK